MYGFSGGNIQGIVLTQSHTDIIMNPTSRIYKSEKGNKRKERKTWRLKNKGDERL